MKSTRIAAVSKDGCNVNEHFGKAERFLIYDLDEQMTLVAERAAEKLSVDDPDHAFDPDKFGRIAALLKDCSKVYVSQIGKLPAEKLAALGIEPVIYRGAIAAIAP